MKTIDIDIDKLGAYFFSPMQYVQNNIAYCEIEYCGRKDADYKIFERWKDSDNKKRQLTSYFKT